MSEIWTYAAIVQIKIAFEMAMTSVIQLALDPNCSTGTHVANGNGLCVGSDEICLVRIPRMQTMLKMEVPW